MIIPGSNSFAIKVEGKKITADLRWVDTDTNEVAFHYQDGFKQEFPEKGDYEFPIDVPNMVTTVFNLTEMIEQNPATRGGWHRSFNDMLKTYDMLPQEEVEPLAVLNSVDEFDF